MTYQVGKDLVLVDVFGTWLGIQVAHLLIWFNEAVMAPVTVIEAKLLFLPILLFTHQQHKSQRSIERKR